MNYANNNISVEIVRFQALILAIDYFYTAIIFRFEI